MEIFQVVKKFSLILQARLNFRRLPVLCTTVCRNPTQASNFGGTFDQFFVRIFICGFLRRCLSTSSTPGCKKIVRVVLGTITGLGCLRFLICSFYAVFRTNHTSESLLTLIWVFVDLVIICKDRGTSECTAVKCSSCKHSPQCKRDYCLLVKCFHFHEWLLPGVD